MYPKDIEVFLAAQRTLRQFHRLATLDVQLPWDEVMADFVAGPSNPIVGDFHATPQYVYVVMASPAIDSFGELLGNLFGVISAEY